MTILWLLVRTKKTQSLRKTVDIFYLPLTKHKSNAGICKFCMMPTWEFLFHKKTLHVDNEISVFQFSIQSCHCPGHSCPSLQINNACGLLPIDLGKAKMIWLGSKAYSGADILIFIKFNTSLNDDTKSKKVTTLQITI